MPRPAVLVRSLVGATVLSLLGAGCGTPSSGDAGEAAATPGRPTAVTSFYPLEFATQRIGGGHVAVSVLTKPGTEPHDLELGGQDTTRIQRADVVIYAKGFQPAVDEAAEQVADPARLLDVSPAARLSLTASDRDLATSGGADPHFWLDPQRYAAVARAIGDRLAATDRVNAAAYEANTRSFVGELEALDAELRKGLASCRIRDLVTSHAAFGYLAARYGFRQHGISGLSPEAEPSAAALEAVSDLVRQRGVTTVYQETLVEPHFAQTVAASTGARLATLDPVEGITAESAAKDYLGVMRSNLATLRRGQDCT
ncbi:MAG TPA: metal ABC transporter substrate-binding protein [Intrasporangium sp.]|uniref:metal ABC transporter substrate-binding protein n=1 Tax=Intrasporangium sp. TaxID=1925024 RepID=UPI002D798750|nr:metal ABC transporter substrate-binding protein [Intrasporangium sp.]HET7399141.1 metal ABC transporter substrate-binding protein [Intrasporangium sp.]